MNTVERLAEVFKYHAPKGNQGERYDLIRNEAKGFANMIERLCPNSVERDEAIKRIQAAVMWANASIAINEAGANGD